jgi:tetratricopeptide (TPR) repeat protein
MTSRYRLGVVCTLAVALVLGARPAFAQRASEVVGSMQQLASDLGVACTYCHVTGADKRVNYRSDENPKKAIARKMIEMTVDINARVFLATGAGATGGASVTCATCHRGVPVPMPIATIVGRTITLEGVDAAVARYRALRKDFYERDTYDFSEAELLRIARQLTEVNPDAAIGLMRMNLEWHPSSSMSYVVMGYSYTRKFDDRTAIPLFEKALELDPENSAARGYLHQLQQYRQKK